MSESESFLARWTKSMRLTIPHPIREILDLKIGELVRVTIVREPRAAQKEE